MNLYVIFVNIVISIKGILCQEFIMRIKFEILKMTLTRIEKSILVGES